VDVSVAALSDYALIDQQEKLSIVGIFGTLGATAEPITHPKMCLVLVFQASRGDYGRVREWIVEVTDSDGRPVSKRIGGEIRIDGTPEFPPIANIIVNFDNYTFPKFGTYSFTVFIDGDIKKELRLEVRQVQAQQSPPPPSA
jgi:hypothetical protein